MVRRYLYTSVMCCMRVAVSIGLRWDLFCLVCAYWEWDREYARGARQNLVHTYNSHPWVRRVPVLL